MTPHSSLKRPPAAMLPADARRKRARRPFLTSLVLVVALVLPWLAPSWQLLELARYSAYMMLAASLAFVWGHCGLLSLGQACFFGIGAYTMAWLSATPWAGLHGLIGSLAAAAAATLASGAAAWLLAWGLCRGRGLQGAYFGIATLAVAVLAERWVTQTPALGGANGLLNIPPFNAAPLGPAEVVEPIQVYALAMGVLAVVMAGLMKLCASPWGQALRAIRDHEARAQALGIDVLQAKTRAFALGGAIAGLAGALFVTQFNFASPALLGFGLSTEALIWVALGGRQHIIAACLGALVVRVLESTLSASLGEGWGLVLGALFVLIVMTRPQGLFGSRLTWPAIFSRRAARAEDSRA